MKTARKKNLHSPSILWPKETEGPTKEMRNEQAAGCPGTFLESQHSGGGGDVRSSRQPMSHSETVSQQRERRRERKNNGGGRKQLRALVLQRPRRQGSGVTFPWGMMASKDSMGKS